MPMVVAAQTAPVVAGAGSAAAAAGPGVLLATAAAAAADPLSQWPLRAPVLISSATPLTPAQVAASSCLLQTSRSSSC